MSLSLSKKVAVSSIILFVVGLTLLTYFSVSTLEKSLSRLLINQQMSMVNFVARDFEEKILLHNDSLQDAADRIAELGVANKARALDFLKQRIALYRFFSNGVVIYDRQGRAIAHYPEVQDRIIPTLSSLESAQEVLATSESAIGKPKLSPYQSRPELTLAVPIKSAQGELIGVLVGFIDLSANTLFNQQQAKLGDTGEFVVVSTIYRTILADSNKNHVLIPLDQLIPQSFVSRCLDNLDGTSFAEDLHGRAAILSDVHILSGRMVILGSLSVDEAFAPIRELSEQIYALAAIGLFLIGGIMWWVMRYQLDVVQRATWKLHRMAFGNAPLQMLEVERNDEIGKMLESFNQLLQKIEYSTAEVQTSRTGYRNLFEHMTQGFVVCELLSGADGQPNDYRLLEVNPAFQRMSGLARDRLVGRTVRELMPNVNQVWIDQYATVVAEGVPQSFERNWPATANWYRTMAYRPELGKLAVTVEDITELLRTQQELEHLAQHDLLTGLPNRLLFSDRLQWALAQTRRRKTLLAVGYLDLDKFKPVNDRFGHAVGDLLLVEVARRFRSALREEDVISRLGGDEFALLIVGLKAREELEELLGRLLAIIGAPYLIDEHAIDISMSMGLTVYPHDNNDADILLRHADSALYTAKQMGRNQYRFYEAVF
jgi:diguanylate cyclase (GGDEF)-like protein/PAS domain S-box-containing protein